MAASHRFPRKTTDKAREAFFETLRTGRAAEREPVRVDVVASTCTGLSRLSEHLGVRLHHVAAVGNPVRHARELSLRRYGALVLDGGPRGFTIESGWDDWRISPMTHEMTRGEPLVPGAMLACGRLRLQLPATAARADFKRGLAASMDAMRFDVALLTGVAIARRHRAGADLAVHPRYAGESADSGWERAGELYVFDPWRDLMRLAVIASASAVAAMTTSLTSAETRRSPSRAKRTRP